MTTMRRFSVDTSSPDVATSASYDLFGNRPTFRDEPTRAFSCTLDGFGGDTGFSAARVRLPVRMRVDSGDLPGYTIILGRSGVNRWRSGNAEGSLAVPLLLPPQRSTAIENIRDNVELVALGFTVGAVERYLGRPPMRSLNFDAANTPRTPPVALTNFVSYVGDTFDSSPDIVEHPLVEAALVDSVLALALASFNLGGTDADLNSGAMPGALKRATTFISENLESPITAIDIAEAARMSPRGLQALFQRELWTTPTAYLRHLRLAAAKADLLAADPANTDVASIATRWGFTHPSRFAAMYRAEFGENPSTTLRR
jgi:AraC-like DNA-binding protein